MAEHLLSLTLCVGMCDYRRIRELNENNTKKFIEERKRQAMLQARDVENLQKIHGEQNETLQKELERVYMN